MAEWSQNNRACKTLWLTLVNLNRIYSNFDESGDKTMAEITEPSENLNDFVKKLDYIFRVERGAKYKTGYDQEIVIQNMKQVLIEPDQLVRDLAYVIDFSYDFYNN